MSSVSVLKQAQKIWTITPGHSDEANVLMQFKRRALTHSNNTVIVLNAYEVSTHCTLCEFFSIWWTYPCLSMFLISLHYFQTSG